MKTILLNLLMLLIPVSMFAQWNMVRFDEYNYFNRSFTITPASVVFTGNGPSFAGSFILRSNDGGATWDSVPLSTPTINYQLDVLFFNDVNNGFAGGLKNITQVFLKTQDNGSSWTEATPDPLSVMPVRSISFVNPQEGFAADEFNIYKTSDAGNTWTTLTPSFAVSDINFNDMDNGYAGGYNGSFAVVMKTDDGGQNWTNVLTASDPFMANSSIDDIDLINNNILFASHLYRNVIYKTLDGGLTWDTLTLPLIYSIQDFDFINANEGHVLSTMGEIFGTTDGGMSWVLEYSVAGGAYGPSVFLNSITFTGISGSNSTGFVCGSSGLIKKFIFGTTGISETLNEEISIYPNPVSLSDGISVKGLRGTYKIEVINALGQTIHAHEGININNGPVNFRSASKLSDGVYMIRIVTGDGSFTSHLIIQR